MPQDSHLKPRLQRSVALGSVITCPVVSWRRDWRPIRCHCPSAPLAARIRDSEGIGAIEGIGGGEVAQHDLLRVASGPWPRTMSPCSRLRILRSVSGSTLGPCLGGCRRASSRPPTRHPAASTGGAGPMCASNWVYEAPKSNPSDPQMDRKPRSSAHQSARRRNALNTQEGGERGLPKRSVTCRRRRASDATASSPRNGRRPR
jgi:hypothetical protein